MHSGQTLCTHESWGGCVGLVGRAASPTRVRASSECNSSPVPKTRRQLTSACRNSALTARAAYLSCFFKILEMAV